MTVEDILCRYDEKIAALGFQLREFLCTHLKNIKEETDTSVNIIGYNFGTGYKHLICTIIPSKKGIKLGFYKGAELPDPGKLLTGTGKVHRYVEIHSEQDINDPALLQLLKQAVKAYNERIKQ